ncbi:MAG: hypothetical protein ACFE9C_14235 [Candidatus Hodarchaeota archaeon]
MPDAQKWGAGIDEAVQLCLVSRLPDLMHSIRTPKRREHGPVNSRRCVIHHCSSKWSDICWCRTATIQDLPRTRIRS